jgi:hypothetical protein
MCVVLSKNAAAARAASFLQEVVFYHHICSNFCEMSGLEQYTKMPDIITVTH